MSERVTHQPTEQLKDREIEVMLAQDLDDLSRITENRTLWLHHKLFEPGDNEPFGMKVHTKEREIQENLTVFDASVDDNGILSLDLGMLHNTSELRAKNGAKATLVRAIMQLNQTDANELSNELQQINERFNNIPPEISKLKKADREEHTRLWRLQAQQERAMAAEKYYVASIQTATSLDIEWHGFGGNALALELDLKESLLKSGDSNKIKFILSIMGSDDTRLAQFFNNGLFKYDLDKQGANQVNYSAHEIHRFIANIKKQQSDYVRLRNTTYNGHSMGGLIDFVLALQDDAFTAQMKAYEIYDESWKKLYILNTPVPEGYKTNHKAVPLLNGTWGITMQVFSSGVLLHPVTAMRLGNAIGLVRRIHKGYFDTQTRSHIYQLAAHLVQAQLDPGYLAQCVRSLYDAPRMRDLAVGHEETLQRLIKERSIIALLAQEDIILDPHEQFDELYDLHVPMFSLPGLTHYITEQQVIRALQSGDVQAFMKLQEEWLLQTKVVDTDGKTVSYLTALWTAAKQYADVKQDRVGAIVSSTVYDYNLRRAERQLQNLIKRFFGENGFILYSGREIIPLADEIRKSKKKIVQGRLPRYEAMKKLIDSRHGMFGIFAGASDPTIALLREITKVNFRFVDTIEHQRLYRKLEVSDAFNPTPINKVLENAIEMQIIGHNLHHFGGSGSLMQLMENIVTEKFDEKNILRRLSRTYRRQIRKWKKENTRTLSMAGPEFQVLRATMHLRDNPADTLVPIQNEEAYKNLTAKLVEYFTTL